MPSTWGNRSPDIFMASNFVGWPSGQGLERWPPLGCLFSRALPQSGALMASASAFKGRQKLQTRATLA
jgi:hypothetical protein